MTVAAENEVQIQNQTGQNHSRLHNIWQVFLAGYPNSDETFTPTKPHLARAGTSTALTLTSETIFTANGQMKLSKIDCEVWRWRRRVSLFSFNACDQHIPEHGRYCQFEGELYFNTTTSSPPPPHAQPSPARSTSPPPSPRRPTQSSPPPPPQKKPHPTTHFHVSSTQSTLHPLP